MHLHPPRAAQAEAREWQIRVVAGSRATGTDAGSASARLTVQAYQDVETDLRPERATGRRRGKFAFAVRNLANAPIELEFSATDPEGKCKFAIKQRRGTAQPGKRAGTELIVKAPKQIWVGRPLDHPFQIVARAPGSEETVISRQAVFRQRPWFAWWVPIALVTALALGRGRLQAAAESADDHRAQPRRARPPRRCRRCSSTSASCSRTAPAKTKSSPPRTRSARSSARTPTRASR